MKKYLPDFIFGSIDGLITTFAIVSGVVGASLSTVVILILGFANLLADGFSMGVSSYLSNKSEDELNNQYVAGSAVAEPATKSPFCSGVITFFSFVVVGFVPLLAFVFHIGANPFVVSAVLTLICFFVVGYIKGKVVNKKPFA